MNVHSTEITAASWKALDPAGKAHAIIAVYNDRHNTAGTIAARLSVMFGSEITRNSVVGVYHRVTAGTILKDFPLKGYNPFLDKSRIGRTRAARMGLAAPKAKPRVSKIPQPMGPEIIPEMRAPSAPEPFLKTMVELERDECRWPVDGDKEKIRFCCHEIKAGTSYCEFHHNLSRGRGTPSERAADRVLKRFAA